MKLITFALLFAPLCFAGDPPKQPIPEKFPIPAEYMTLFNGLVQNLQAAQKAVQTAEEKLRADLCKERGFAVADCVVDWQSGSVSKRVVVATGELPKTAPEKKP